MYLDTKNMMSATTTTTTTATSTKTTTTESVAPKVRRMRKMWLPLRRLLAVGGKGRPPHPNNVDLNNMQSLSSSLSLSSSSSSSSVQCDQELEPNSKQAADSRLDLIQVEEEEAATMQSLPPTPPMPALISSVYVEKTNGGTAPGEFCGCQHGRNCRHAHRFSTPTVEQPPALIEALQYISTDNGTFFWANTQERIDDDLLHAWLCQSLSQLPGTLC